MDRILIWQLAIRYLRGKRTANAVPILSRISMVAIAVCSAAMIIIFSAFNGLEFFVKEMYKAFYPEIRITAARGKFFSMDDARLTTIGKLEGVTAMSRVIEDNALVNNTRNSEQKVVTLKGVDRHYMDVVDLRQYIERGIDTVTEGTPNTAIAGTSILNTLGLDVDNVFSSFELYYLNPDVTNPEANPLSAFQTVKMHPVGVFAVQGEFDDKYILAALPLAQELFHAEGKYSSIELKTDPSVAEKTKARLKELLGNTFKVETRYEQNRTLYAVMGTEKWAVYAILVLVLLIASFNMVGALSMLVLEKQKDIAILKAMGARQITIRQIFFAEGMLWAITGGGIGIILGTVLSFAQQQFGFIKMGTSFLVDSYPIQVQLTDILLVAGTILTVGFLASWLPAIRATRVIDPSLKST